MGKSRKKALDLLHIMTESKKRMGPQEVDFGSKAVWLGNCYAGILVTNRTIDTV